MALGQQSVNVRYFWSGWFTGYSFRQLALLYVVLSLADLYATLRLIPFEIREGNALARHVLEQYDFPGFLAYKVALVAFVLLVVKIIDARDARRSEMVLWAANIAMAYVAILHITIMIATVYMHRL